jgi:hypothetical protein
MNRLCVDVGGGGGGVGSVCNVRASTNRNTQTLAPTSQQPAPANPTFVTHLVELRPSRTAHHLQHIRDGEIDVSKWGMDVHVHMQIHVDMARVCIQ